MGRWAIKWSGRSNFSLDFCKIYLYQNSCTLCMNVWISDFKFLFFENFVSAGQSFESILRFYVFCKSLVPTCMNMSIFEFHFPMICGCLGHGFTITHHITLVFQVVFDYDDLVKIPYFRSKIESLTNEAYAVKISCLVWFFFYSYQIMKYTFFLSFFPSSNKYAYTLLYIPYTFEIQEWCW